jgi:hypothetical protein
LWRAVLPFARLRLSGTGTITIDARDASGTVTTAVWSTTLAGSNGTIFYPFFAASAVAIRAAVTGNVYAEII